MNTDFEKAFKNYFGNNQESSTIKDRTGDIAKPEDETYTYRTEENNIRTDVGKRELRYNVPVLMADGNIDKIDDLIDIIKKLCNAAWGSDWGEIGPDLKRGEDSGEIIMPQITVEVNERDIADHMPLKPVLMNTVKEIVDGQPTGDSLLMYRQWFDCNIEFDFYGHSPKEVRELQYNFEMLIQIYTGYLKRHGVSEFIFLREFPSKSSLNFTENTPMRTTVFYARIERVTPVRMSLINKVNATIGLREINNQAVESVIEHNQSINIMSDASLSSLEFDIDIDFSNSEVDYSDV